jgi:Domain of unknown function (DUF4440)
MKSYLLFFAASGTGLLAADATGTWTGKISRDQSEHPAHLILKQEGKVLTGTGGPGADLQMPLRNGVAEPDGRLTFEIEQGNAVMKFTLRQDGDAISGDLARTQDGNVETAALRVARTPDLKQTITALDAGMFAAYNNCELDKFRQYLASDIEFFHDFGGVMTGADAVVEAGRKNVCGKVRRELVSLNVYPIPGYGAIEEGLHKFYNRSSGKEEGGDKLAKFLHIWRNQGGEWKITRVVSYAH